MTFSSLGHILFTPQSCYISLKCHQFIKHFLCIDFYKDSYEPGYLPIILLALTLWIPGIGSNFKSFQELHTNAELSFKCIWIFTDWLVHQDQIPLIGSFYSHIFVFSSHCWPLWIFQLDPDAENILEKFRTAQNVVRRNKEKLDNLKLDTLQKVDLLIASRYNLFSQVLSSKSIIFQILGLKKPFIGRIIFNEVLTSAWLYPLIHFISIYHSFRCSSFIHVQFSNNNSKFMK